MPVQEVEGKLFHTILQRSECEQKNKSQYMSHITKNRLL